MRQLFYYAIHGIRGSRDTERIERVMEDIVSAFGPV